MNIERLKQRLKDRLSFCARPSIYLFDSGRELKTGLRARPVILMPKQDRLLIGYGRNLLTQGIAEDEADVLLTNDVQRMREACLKHVSLGGGRFDSFSVEEQESIIYTLLVNGGEVNEDAFRSHGARG